MVSFTKYIVYNQVYPISNCFLPGVTIDYLLIGSPYSYL